MSIYATNRIASIAEDSQICEEIMEAYADKTRETANLSNYGIIAQLHENDMRMFDAIISADFASASSANLLEGAELAALNEKMENAAASKIWDRIMATITAIKEAVIKVARLFRDKVSNLINADKKILAKFTKPIENLPADFNLNVKFALPKESLSKIASEASKSYNDIKREAGKINSFGLQDDDVSMDAGIQDYKDNIDEINKKLIASVDDIFTTDDNKISKSDAKSAVLELMSGKNVVKAAKKNADDALKTVKELEKAAKAAQKKNAANPKVGAQVYSLVSGIGAATNKAMHTVNNALTQILAANRRIVLAAGHAALRGEKTVDAKQEAAILDALFEASDLYVAEVCEMV
jgi:hypothetical protein